MENNFNVAILTEVGECIGFGHLSRCLSVFQVFVEKKIIPNLVVNLKGNVEKAVFPETTKFYDWSIEKAQLKADIQNVDIVIIDSYIANQELYEEITDIVSTCVYFDDFDRINYPKGIVINGALNAEEIDYPKNDHIKYLLGIEYQPFRKAFWNIENRFINIDIENILITLGANDSYNLIPQISEILKVIIPNAQRNVLLSKLSPNYAELIKKTDDKFKIFSDLNENDVKDLMFKSDIAICAGGQTLYECLVTGLPTIAVKTADNQSKNIEGFIKHNLIYYGGNWDDNNLICRIESIIKNELSYQNRQDINLRVKEVIVSNGSKNIVKRILKSHTESCLTVRKVISEDVINIFNLANDNVVRENSFNQDKIIFENHLKWFNARIVDPNTLFLVIEVKGKFSGQIRYDINGDVATINISIVDSFRGLSVGEIAIKKSIKKLQQIYSNIVKIDAFVKTSNVSSKIVFEKAGFILDNVNKEIKGSYKYIYFL